jgi:excisionase family DNA binding protein
MTAPVPIKPICVKINDAARMIGVGRTKLYELITAGEVEAVKLGKLTRVSTDARKGNGNAIGTE